jgi:hypothetical protein
VFFDACVDKDGPRGEWLDVAIVEPSSALSQYTFVVYTAGVLNLPESVAYYIGP